MSAADKPSLSATETPESSPVAEEEEDPGSAIVSGSGNGSGHLPAPSTSSASCVPHFFSPRANDDDGASQTKQGSSVGRDVFCSAVSTHPSSAPQEDTIIPLHVPLSSSCLSPTAVSPPPPSLSSSSSRVRDEDPCRQDYAAPERTNPLSSNSSLVDDSRPPLDFDPYAFGRRFSPGATRSHFLPPGPPFPPDGSLVGPNHPGFGNTFPTLSDGRRPLGGRLAGQPRFDPYGPFGSRTGGEPDPDHAPFFGSSPPDHMFL